LYLPRSAYEPRVINRWFKKKKKLAPDRYLASFSNLVKHHNENERPYSTIKTSSSSSMITINIKLGETTEPKKNRKPSHPYPRAKKQKHHDGQSALTFIARVIESSRISWQILSIYCR